MLPVARCRQPVRSAGCAVASVDEVSSDHCQACADTADCTFFNFKRADSTCKYSATIKSGEDCKGETSAGYDFYEVLPPPAADYGSKGQLVLDLVQHSLGAAQTRRRLVEAVTEGGQRPGALRNIHVFPRTRHQCSFAPRATNV